MRSALTTRWTNAILHRRQLAYLNSQARFNVVAAGRRSFKTEAAKRRLISKAMGFTGSTDGRFFACAPTHAQAHDIFWQDLQDLTPEWALRGRSKRAGVSESKRTIYLGNGAQIRVAGLDKPQRIEGGWWDGGVISEYADVKSGVLDRHIKPMMIRGGWLDIEGVPEGRGHFFDIWERAADPDLDSWARHTWTTEDVLHLYLGAEAAAAELAESRATMDPLVFRQEYCAEWLSFEGLAYYAFERDANLPPSGQDVNYDPGRDLIVCLDFNRAPGIAVYAQELPPSAVPWLQASRRSPTITGVIGEVWIPRASNTEKVCDKIIADWGERHRGDVLVHGDPAGGAQTSQAVAGSDWDIVRRKLGAAFGHRFKERWARSAPRVRARVNAFNTRLQDAEGGRALAISRRARHLIDDLEGVEADEAGNMIKKPGPLTHLSDALGYYFSEKWPCGERVFAVSR